MLKMIELRSAGIEVDAKPHPLIYYLRRGHPYLTIGIVTSHLRNSDTVVIIQSHLVRWASSKIGP